ncbi:hypothetical protein ACLB1N_18720 [Escherichia coli]
MTAVSGWSDASPDDGNHLPLHTTGSGELQADSPGSKCVGAAGRSSVGMVARIAAPAAPSRID